MRIFQNQHKMIAQYIYLLDFLLFIAF